METFSALLALCEGNHRSPVESPHKGQSLSDAKLWCFLWSTSEQTFEQTTGELRTPSRSLWPHCNGVEANIDMFSLNKPEECPLHQEHLIMSSLLRFALSCPHRLVVNMINSNWGWRINTMFCSVKSILAYVYLHVYLVWGALKTKDNQFDNFVVTGGTVSCHYDNLRCQQWR